MAEKQEQKKKNVHSGHRKRLRKEFEIDGFEGKAEHVVLEYLLQAVLPRVDTNETAHELIEKCGGFANVFRASKEQLTDVFGVGEKAAEYLHTLGEFVHYYNGKRFEVNRKTLNAENCGEYLLDIFDGKEREYCYLICLDAGCRIISKTQMFEGGFEGLDVDVHEIVRFALKCDASYVVLTHNHPSGIAEPSNADIVATQTISRILGLCGIKLYDHIIVANGKCISMKNSGVLDSKRMPRIK